jgi:predicted O-methyltransferase YrrM
MDLHPIPLPTLRATAGIHWREGHSGQVPTQQRRLVNLAEAKKPARILEIGFNAGHSAELLLQTCPEAHVTSVDIGYHDYVRSAKHAIDKAYPGRHTLILGDSLNVIPHLADVLRPEMRFELVFIDGGHDYPIATGDLCNCRAIAAPDAVVIMDDTYRSREAQSFNKGPTRAWDEAVAAGWVNHEGADEYQPARGMSWGRYRPE